MGKHCRQVKQQPRRKADPCRFPHREFQLVPHGDVTEYDPRQQTQAHQQGLEPDWSLHHKYPFHWFRCFSRSLVK